MGRSHSVLVYLFFNYHLSRGILFLEPLGSRLVFLFCIVLFNFHVSRGHMVLDQLFLFLESLGSRLVFLVLKYHVNRIHLLVV